MNDLIAVGSAIGAAVGTVAVKMTVDKVRGNGHSGVQKALDEHKTDDLDKFDKLGVKIDRMVEKFDAVAQDVAFIRGQLSKEN